MHCVRFVIGVDQKRMQCVLCALFIYIESVNTIVAALTYTTCHWSRQVHLPTQVLIRVFKFTCRVSSSENFLFAVMSSGLEPIILKSFWQYLSCLFKIWIWQNFEFRSLVHFSLLYLNGQIIQRSSHTGPAVACYGFFFQQQMSVDNKEVGRGGLS